MKEKKIALVTGGTSGVGLSIVKELIQQDYYVVFIGSNNTKGKALEAGFNIDKSACSEFVCLDLCNLKKVYSFANGFINKYNRLDVLANVAGVILPKREITEDGFEKTFAIGYLCPFILSLQLTPLLKKTEGARIVNVSAQAKSVLPLQLDFDDLNFTKEYNGFKVSLLTVHAKTVLTEIFAEKMVVHGIDVNAFHPGIVRSGLARNLPFALQVLAKIFYPFMSKKSENGIFVSGSQQLKGFSGNLYVNKKAIPLNFTHSYKEALWLKTHVLLKKLMLNLNDSL